MHPAGVQFGLSCGLLQLNGDKVVVSDSVLDAVSAHTRVLVRRKDRVLPIGRQFGDEVIGPPVEEALRRENRPIPGKLVPFLNGLTSALFHRLIPIAENAGIVHMKGSQMYPTDEFSGELWDRIEDLKPARDLSHPRQLVFEACRDTVAAYCAQRDPSSMIHSELITLFLLNIWCFSGTLSLLEQAVYD
jgi:hypothetical protein